MYTYAYIIGILIIVPIWITFFAMRKDLRPIMLIIGFYVACLAIMTDFLWFLKDYWNPLKYISAANLIWQDFLLGFFLGGSIAVAYEVIFKKRTGLGQLQLKIAVILLVIILAPFILLTTLLKVNSIYSSSIGLIISLVLILIRRKDLIINSLISGSVSLCIALVGYTIFQLIYPHIFKDWWMLKNLSGIVLLNIPVEELLWFISFGLITGPLYNFLYTNQPESSYC